MLDLLSTFVIVFFVSYVVLSYVRPSIVLCIRDNKIAVSQGKLMLTSILFALVALLVHVLQKEKPQLRFGRRSILYY